MNTKEQIKDYILNLIGQGEKHLTRKVCETFSISRSTVYNYTNELIRSGTVLRGDDGSLYLAILKTGFVYTLPFCEEDRAFKRDILPLLKQFPDNVTAIWRHAFTEMMNNAIEHSESDSITVAVYQSAIDTQIVILDNGVGIFNKIRQYMRTEKDEDIPLEECVSLLFAGKFTTARQNHSGEGIFFTSHLMDSFFIVSDRLIFTRNNFTDGTAPAEFMEHGTLVQMKLSNKSHKTVTEVFNRYTDDGNSFSKTSIPIAHIFTDGYPVSRSEARRLGSMLSEFEEAVLDFNGVPGIGQAFTHELFVVWQKNHPDIHLELVNVPAEAAKMISRVKHDAGIE